MKKASSILKIFLYSVAALTLLTPLLFTISMFTAFDADVGYFSSAKILPYIQTALMTVSIIFFAAIMFFFPKKSLPREKQESSKLDTFASLFCGIVFLCGAAIKFFSTYNNTAAMSPSQKYLFIAITISGLIAAAHFIRDAIIPSGKAIGSKIISGIFVIGNLLLTIVLEHTDYMVPINAPRKTLLFLGFISASMFIVQEMRAKTNILLPRAYMFFGATTTLICGTMSVSGLIAHYAGVFKCDSFLVYYLIALAFAIYASSKTGTYIKNAEESFALEAEKED